MSSAKAQSPPPSVAIILVNWNNWRDCLENIDSVLALNYPAFHIFLVDNDSHDDSIENIRAWCARPLAQQAWRRHAGVDRWTDRDALKPLQCHVVDNPQEPLPAPDSDCRITLIRSGGNLGFAAGCNLGVRCGGLDNYQFFWLLNTDTVVHRDALSALVERAAADSQIGMVGSTVIYYDQPDTVQALAGACMNPELASSRHIGQGAPLADVGPNVAFVEQQLTYIFGASMLVSSNLIRAIGPMREDYFLYYEEADWAMRARKLFKFGYAPQSHVFHKSGSSSSRSMPLFSANLYYRNQLRFMSRFYPEHLSAVKRSLTKEVVRYAVKCQWSRARLVASILFEANNIAAQALAPSA